MTRDDNSNGFGNYWIDGLHGLWSDEDQQAAISEGWRIYLQSRLEGDLVSVQAYEQGLRRPMNARFRHDQHALAHVEAKADQNSPLHLKAMVCLMAVKLRG